MTAGRQVRYLFTSTDGREIELRGFIVRESLISSNAPAKYNAAFKAASILDIIPPPMIEGAETSETDLIAYAKKYGFTLTRTDGSGDNTNLNTAPSGLTLDSIENVIDDLSVDIIYSYDLSGDAEIYRSRSSDRNFQKIGVRDDGTYRDVTVIDGETYYYKVRPYVGTNFGAFSNVMSITAVDNSEA